MWSNDVLKWTFFEPAIRAFAAGMKYSSRVFPLWPYFQDQPHPPPWDTLRNKHDFLRCPSSYQQKTALAKKNKRFLVLWQTRYKEEHSFNHLINSENRHWGPPTPNDHRRQVATMFTAITSSPLGLVSASCNRPLLCCHSAWLGDATRNGEVYWLMSIG